MKTELLLYALNDIQDEYLAEYAEKAKMKRVKKSYAFLKWNIAVACLILMSICIPVMLHRFMPSEMDDPRAGVNYNFKNYSEFCDILPDDHIFTNIPNSEKANMSITGICPSGTTDFTEYNNFSYFYIIVQYEDGTGLGINCIVNYWKTLEEYLESRWLFYPPEKTKEIDISGYEIYYVFHGEDDTLNAVFLVDGDLFEIRSGSLDEDKLIRLISEMLDV